jgi:hypothetical protein
MILNAVLAISHGVDLNSPCDQSNRRRLVVMLTRLDPLARSIRDVLNTLAEITGKQAGFRSPGDAWAGSTHRTAA